MPAPIKQKFLLQFTVAIACLVPLLAGGYGMLYGEWFYGGNIDLDSHFRYLSGLLFAIGIGFLSTIPNIEKHKRRFQLLTFLVVVGGIGRLIGIIIHGIPDSSMLFALAMELVVTPLLCLWQRNNSDRLLKNSLG